MTIAITREVSSRFNECEITHIDRALINVNAARAEHHESPDGVGHPVHD